jgi:hypothetical protein
VVYQAVRREVSVPTAEWRSRTLEEMEAGDGDEKSGTALSLDHLFTLLGLVLERRSLQPAMQALLGRNPKLRGTALEYLDNVLPADIRRRLWGHLGVPEGGAARRRGSGADG